MPQASASMIDLYPWNVGPCSLPEFALVRCLSQQREVTNTVTATSWGGKPVCIVCSREINHGEPQSEGVLHMVLLGVEGNKETGQQRTSDPRDGDQA